MFSFFFFFFLLKQPWQCSPAKEVAWNLLSLFTASGMLCLEISLMAFLLKDNYMNGMEALAHSFLATGIIVFVDYWTPFLRWDWFSFILVIYTHVLCIFICFVKYQWIFMTKWCLNLFILSWLVLTYTTIAWYITAQKTINQCIGNFAEKESSQLANHHSLISATLITTMIATLF